MKVRDYICGIKFTSDKDDPPTPFVRKRDTTLPKCASMITVFFKGTISQAEAFANAMLYADPEDIPRPSQKTTSVEEAILPKEVISIFIKREELILKPGVIAHHDDDCGSHMALLLQRIDNKWLCLFFSSNPNWSKSRRATKDELALASFCYSKATYLSLCMKNSCELTPTEITFPEHRLNSLIKEFQWP